MNVNVVMPKLIPYIQVLFRTKKFYKLTHITNVVADDKQRYYIFLRKRNMQIKIVETGDETFYEIQKYLTYTFKNSYLGIHGDVLEKIQLPEVRTIRM